MGMQKIVSALNSAVYEALEDAGINDDFGADIVEDKLHILRYSDDGNVIAKYEVTYNITPID